jgi:hypothetical protein
MTLESIAETLSGEFSRAVAAEQKARSAAVDLLTQARAAADEARIAGMSRVREARKEAADIVAQSLKDEERIEADWRRANAEIDDMLAEMRGGSRTLKQPRLKAVGAE